MDITFRAPDVPDLPAFANEDEKREHRRLVQNLAYFLRGACSRLRIAGETTLRTYAQFGLEKLPLVTLRLLDAITRNEQELRFTVETRQERADRLGYSE